MEIAKSVTLQEISTDNWLECLRLQLSDKQQGLVASNAFSLVQASYNSDCFPLVIYQEETMVGFLMWGRNDCGQYWIMRLMVDYRYQGQGYGKAALESAIALLHQKPDCHEIFIDYIEGNIIAEKLYRSLGFVPTGEKNDREIIMRLPLNR